ncbi:unnamed protein product [Closterium sp. Naga37s-1]|nr:unnamed protein product [Closterium sp. Naga37s-1]
MYINPLTPMPLSLSTPISQSSSDLPVPHFSATQTAYAIGTLSKEAIACLEQQAMTSARAVVEKYMRRCAHADVDCDWRIACGDERDVICREVMRVCADVLIVGTRSLPAAKKALLGSVSEYCAHHSACPVIIVRPKELKSEVIAAQRSVVSEALPQGC